MGFSTLDGLTMGTLPASAQPRAELAVDHFVETAAREFAGMFSTLRGIDTLVFTGGIGQHSAPVRARLARVCGWMGLTLDDAASAAGAAGARVINAPGSAVQSRVLRTDEESVIARHALHVAGLTPSAPDATIDIPPCVRRGKILTPHRGLGQRPRGVGPPTAASSRASSGTEPPAHAVEEHHRFVPALGHALVGG